MSTWGGKTSSWDPNGTITCKVSHTITETDLDAGSVNNVSSSTGKDPSTNAVTSLTDNETVTAIQNPSISIVKSSDATGTNGVGDTITYSYFVTNEGNVTLSSLSVTDPHTGLGTITCAAIAQGESMLPGGSTTCTATDRWHQADGCPGPPPTTGNVDSPPPRTREKKTAAAPESEAKKPAGRLRPWEPETTPSQQSSDKDTSD